jgi:hypothetical protein
MATTKVAAPSKMDIRSLRSALDTLRGTDDLLVSSKEINPALELAALSKNFDGGYAMLLENVKGYPNGRLLTNLFASEERVARLFGVDDPRQFKFKCMETGPAGTYQTGFTLLIVSISLATFMSALDGTIVNIALPTISSAFDISTSTVSWVSTVYLLVMAGCVLIFGKISPQGKLPVAVSERFPLGGGLSSFGK